MAGRLLARVRGAVQAGRELSRTGPAAERLQADQHRGAAAVLVQRPAVERQGDDLALGPVDAAQGVAAERAPGSRGVPRPGLRLSPPGPAQPGLGREARPAARR